MCIIAGYSGNKNAAPILIEMMRKEQFVDGGLSTGIATIHEGKLHFRKVVGDVDTLLRETDALSLPGTTGIIHSRTGGNLVAHAHPFLSNDGNLALITNGTTHEANCPEFHELVNELAKHFVDRGFEFKTAYEKAPDKIDNGEALPDGKGFMSPELYAFMIEEFIEGCPEENLKAEIAKATRNVINTLPRNFVTMNVHAKIPDTITIGNCARPVTVGFGDGETFLATIPMALPDDIQKRPVIHLPTTTVAQVSPNGLNILSTSIENARVEDVDYRTASAVRVYLEKALKGKKDNPLSIYDMAFTGDLDWENVWAKPYIDSKFVGKGYFKPYAAICYNALFSFHKEGRLHSVIGERNGNKITKYWID